MVKLFGIILVLNFSIILQAQDYDLLRTEIDKIIRFDTEIDVSKTPGFLIGIIDDKQSYIFSYGANDFRSNKMLTTNDVFEIGSVTKVFTSYLCHELEKAGKLSLSDPVNDYIDISSKNPRLQDVTINDLINHTSGLPLRPKWFGKKEKNAQNPYEHYSQHDLLTFYRDFILNDKEKKFEYSHTNYAILEIVIQKATSLSMEDAFQKYVAEPIGLENSHFDLGENKFSLIQGFDRSRKKVDPWTFSSFKASEGLKLPMSDAMTFLRHVLGYAFESPSSEFSTFNKNLSMHHGWHLLVRDKTNIITHMGKTSGHFAFISMVPQTNTGVIILTNSVKGTEDLGFQILRMINYNWKRSQNI